jgi:nucleotide-binding universal stress UspA family protein
MPKTKVPTSILVAFDLSQVGEAACKFAINAIARDGDHIILAVTYPDESLREATRLKSRAYAEQLQMEAVRVKNGESKRVNVDFVVEKAAPGEVGLTILKISKNLVVDVLVCGSSGKSKLGTVLGSTSQFLLQHADRPIVIYREPEVKR